MAEEEWGPPSPRRQHLTNPSSPLSSYRDYLSDITAEEERYLKDEGSPLMALESLEEGEESTTIINNSPASGASTANQQRPLPTLSPFSPEFRKRSKRKRTTSTQEPRNTAVTWGDEPVVNSTADNCVLSLSAEHVVSVIIQVLQPPPKTNRQEREGRLPCVFPIAAFDKPRAVPGREANLITNGAPEVPSSPTAVAMNVVDETRKLMVVNPTAFGKDVPNKVSMEVLRKIVGRTKISSEDWAREYRFNQVLWPSGSLAGMVRLARAMAQDMQAPASIAHRTIFGYGVPDKQFFLFGDCIHDTVAQSFAYPSASGSPEDSLQQFELVELRYGLVGLTLYELLKYKKQQEQLGINGIVIGLSMLEITGEEKFVDLAAKWANWRASSAGVISADGAPPTLKLIYDGKSDAGGVLSGLRIHEVESLKAQGHFFRRAFKMVNQTSRETKRGHVVATLYLYRNTSDFGATTKLPVAHFVDLATPTAIDLTHTKKESASAMAQTRRNANVRKSITALGAVMRSMLLREAGNQVTLSWRESMLTKVLQNSIDHPDGRSVLLTSISPMIEEYEKTMEYLRFCNRLLERPGEPPKSPFDTLSRAATNTTSPTSLTSEPSEFAQISLSEFDEEYHPSLLQTLTSDARQRLTRAGFRHSPAARNIVYLSSQHRNHSSESADLSSGYEHLDPGDFDEHKQQLLLQRQEPNDEKLDLQARTPASAVSMSQLKTPQAHNVSARTSRSASNSTTQHQTETVARQLTLDKILVTNTTEQGSFAGQIPSPLTTSTGRDSLENPEELAKVSRNLMDSNKRQPQGPESNGNRPKQAPQQPLGVPTTVLETEDADTVSQIGELDATHARLSQNQRENAEAVTRHLRLLHESEQSIVKRITAERDALRIKLDRMTKEHDHAIMTHERELRELRHQADKNIIHTKELEQIAEEAVMENEHLGNRVKTLEEQLRKLQAETVPQASYDQMERENRMLNTTVSETRDDLRAQKAEASRQEERILELEGLLRTRELEYEHKAQAQLRDAERLAELEEQLRGSRAEVMSLQSQVASLTRDFAHAEDDFKIREQEWKLRQEETEGNLDVLRVELEESKGEVKSAKANRVELRDENERLRKEVLILEESLRQKDDQCERLQSTLAEMSDQLDARAADVTELTAVAEALEGAKSELHARLEEERAAKARVQVTANGLMEALEKMSDETRKRLEPLVLHRRQERAINRDLVTENEELIRRNERMQTRIESLMQQVAESDRRSFQGEILYRGPPSKPLVCQVCQKTPLEITEGASRDYSREQLENLALDLSLIVRQLSPRKLTGDPSRGLEGLEEQVMATERITDLMLKMIRQRAREIRLRLNGEE